MVQGEVSQIPPLPRWSGCGGKRNLFWKRQETKGIPKAPAPCLSRGEREREKAAFASDTSMGSDAGANITLTSFPRFALYKADRTLKKSFMLVQQNS